MLEDLEQLSWIRSATTSTVTDTASRGKVCSTQTSLGLKDAPLGAQTRYGPPPAGEDCGPNNSQTLVSRMRFPRRRGVASGDTAPACQRDTSVAAPQACQVSRRNAWHSQQIVSAAAGVLHRARRSPHHFADYCGPPCGESAEPVVCACAVLLGRCHGPGWGSMTVSP